LDSNGTYSETKKSPILPTLDNSIDRLGQAKTAVVKTCGKKKHIPQVRIGAGMIEKN